MLRRRGRQGEGIPVGLRVDSAALPKPGGDKGHGSKYGIYFPNLNPFSYCS